jgi:hypothetical protein
MTLRSKVNFKGDYIMSVKKLMIAGFMMIMAAVFSACGIETNIEMESPTDPSLWMFKKTAGFNTGEIYTKTLDGPPLKVADPALRDSQIIAKDGKKFLYLAPDNRLFYFNGNGRNTFISDSVSRFGYQSSEDGRHILYLKENGDFMSADEGGKSRLLAEKVYFFQTLKDKLYFVDREMVLYQIINGNKIPLAEGVSRFAASAEGAVVFHSSGDGSLYFLDPIGGHELRRLTDGHAGRFQWSPSGNWLLFEDHYDVNTGSGILYLLSINQEDPVSVRIAANADRFIISEAENKVFYSNLKGELFELRLPLSESIKGETMIEDGIRDWNYSADNRTLFFSKNDLSLYVLRYEDGDAPKRIAGSVLQAESGPAGAVVFIDEYHRLTVNTPRTNIEISAKVDQFTVERGHVYYTTWDGSIGVYGFNEAAGGIMLARFEEYDTIYTANDMLSIRLLSPNDIIGFWKHQKEETMMWINATRNNEIEVNWSGKRELTVRLRLKYTTERSMIFAVQGRPSETVSIILGDDGGLLIQMDEIESEWIRSSGLLPLNP